MIMYMKHEERLHFLHKLFRLSTIMSAVRQEFTIWPGSHSWFKQMLHKALSNFLILMV